MDAEHRARRAASDDDHIEMRLGKKIVGVHKRDQSQEGEDSLAMTNSYSDRA